MKILHVTHHEGCKISVDFICKNLGYEIETQRANWNYNMSSDLALQLWNQYKDYYNSFDCIITSDTSSLSRIFLQNNYSKKLIIWVCNRFDYADQSTNGCGFPDPDFYTLFNEARNNPNVYIRSYTKFEYEYAIKYRGINWGDEIIRPASEILNEEKNEFFPTGQKKSDTFFITRYHNDNIYMDLKGKCDSLGIPNYRGEYKGPGDLRDIKGIIHIPYAWSNLAIFENWSLGNVYFIPSKEYLVSMSTGGNFFWSPPFDIDFIESSEWYLPEHSDLFIYFNSFEDLSNLVNNNELIDSTRTKVLEFSKLHTAKTLMQWKTIIEE
jgi:hypothetical protein